MEPELPTEPEPGGYGIRAYSTNSWISVVRDPHSGEIDVRLRQGSLSNRDEREVAAEIRSALIAAAREYTDRRRAENEARYGETPEYLRAWARQS
ncbi:hypothetical protein [Paractinoplanes durhamensis]|uniref:Uncharacterized protein n=1 Tax=Paractinoplanes durhamensis TaxID=113563 RepID=A0ABQ3Z0S6_9ACTN|nr:hypothetical protein [Actinoplanes durhamensis]GIE03440.1 hypothetical protein Adu01nite_47900 [Actinoplanes durhamensis]